MLAAKVKCLEMKLAEKDEEIKLLVRKNSLMEKNMKYRLAKEQNKLKEIELKQDSSVPETIRGSTNIVEVHTWLSLLVEYMSPCKFSYSRKQF